MSGFDDDAAWKARAAEHVRPEQSFFSENARDRFLNAHLPSDAVLEADKINRQLTSTFSPFGFLRMRFSLTQSVVYAATCTYFTGLSSLRIDACLAIAYNVASLLVSFYRSSTTRSFGTESSRILHVAGHQNYTHNSWLFSYLVTKSSMVVAWKLIACIPAVVLQPRLLMTSENLVTTTSTLLIAAIIWKAPQRTTTCVDWILTRLLIVIGIASLSVLWLVNKLVVWIPQLHEACVLFIQERRSFEKFEYTALPIGKIRLLQLPRRLPFRSFKARIIVVDISEAAKYECISYTWGSCIEQQPIVLNGKRFMISRTAWDALKTHSSWWRSLTVWIDQVCINQADHDEKGLQVAMMFDIYRGADRVVAHLGTSPTASAAVSLLSELMWQEYQSSDTEIAGFIYAASILSNTYPALAVMLQHPWFSRAWVVQEIAAAKEVAVVYGGYVIDWESMASAIRVLLRPGIRDPLLANQIGLEPAQLEKVLRQISNIMQMMDIGRRARQNFAGGHLIEVLQLTPAYSLPWVLSQTTNFVATNPRDKIYALQSVSLPSRRPYGKPLRYEYNYSRTVEELYYELALDVMFEFPDPYYMMSFAGLDKRGKLDILPSWVPDWTSSHEWQESFHSRHDVQDQVLVDIVGQIITSPLDGTGVKIRTPKTSCYRAAGASRPIQMFKGHNLAIHGVRIGSITNISELPHPDVLKTAEDSEQYIDRHGKSMFPRRMKKVVAWFDEAKAMTSEIFSDAGASEDAFWRTLIGNRWQDIRPAPAEAYNAFVAWKYLLACWEMVCLQLDVGVTDVVLPQHELFNTARMYEPSWLAAFGAAGANRPFATIMNRYVASVPRASRVGDVVVVALGARTPWVLRPVDKESSSGSQCYEFVGEAYVHELMDGECITSAITWASELWSKHFDEQTKQRDAAERSARSEPAWVDILIEHDLMHSGHEDMGNTDSLSVDDIFQQSDDGETSIPGCEWFRLQ